MRIEFIEKYPMERRIGSSIECFSLTRTDYYINQQHIKIQIIITIDVMFHWETKKPKMSLMENQKYTNKVFGTTLVPK